MKNWQSMVDEDVLRELVQLVPPEVHHRIGEWFDVYAEWSNGDLVPYKDLMELSEELEKAQEEAAHWQEMYKNLLDKDEDDGK